MGPDRLPVAVSRHGFSLVELVVALALASVIGTLALRLAAQALDLERAVGERAGLAASLRAGVSYLERELEALGTDPIAGSDLDSLAAGLVYRAQRGLRVVCRVAVDTVVVHADTGLDWSARQPAAGRDSLLLYVAGDSTVPADGWEPLPITGTFVTSCPGGSPALGLVTGLDSLLIAQRRLGATTVTRVFETVAVRAYAGAAGWQLGQQSLSGGGTIQPLVGGLGANGLTIAGRDPAGVPVAIGPGASLVQLSLRGVTHRQLATGMGPRSPGVIDSVVTAVPLRNRP